MGWLKRKKYKCFMCSKGVGKSAPELKYKYESNKIATVRLCNKCANKLEDTDEMKDAFNEPF